MTDGSAATRSEAGLDVPQGNTASVRTPSGLLARIAVGVGALALGLTVVFVVLIAAVIGLRHRSLEARRSQEVIATANGLQTLVIDFETGLRGFVIWKQQKYLKPWKVARNLYPKKMTKLIQLTANDRHQRAAAYQIKSAIDAYLRNYSA